MQRENQNSSTISHRPKKTVNVNVVVHGDNQSNENSLSQKQDNRVYQEPIPTLGNGVSDDMSLGKPDEGLKEQLARSIQNLDIANDLASQKNIVLPTTLQNIPKSILDVKSSNDIRNLIKHIDNMVLEINKLTSPRVVPSVVPTATQAPQAPQASQAVPTFNNPPNPFRYAQPPPQYTPYTPPYIPPPPYVPPPPAGTVPPPAGTTPGNPVNTNTSTSNIPTNPAGGTPGGRRILQDYEGQGDSLRDQTIVNVQSALQRGDLPVLQNAYAELIQAESTLNQYIALEPRAEVDQQIRAQIMDLDQYKNQLETAITAARQSPQVVPITDEPPQEEPQTEAPPANPPTETPPPATPAPATPPSTQPPPETPPAETPPSTQPPTPGQPGQPVNEFVPYLNTEKRILESYLASRPSTNRPRSIQADSVITTRINNKLNLINMALQKPDLTDDEFDTAMARIPINNIKSWPATRALVILKGEELKPGLNDTVELQPVETPAGAEQLYKLFYNGTELTVSQSQLSQFSPIIKSSTSSTEIFFTQNGEVYTRQDMTPPKSETNINRQNKLNGLYTTGNPLTTQVANVLKVQIEADTGSGTILDRANMNYPAAYAAIVEGVNDQNTVRTLALRPLSMTSFGDNSDQAYSLIVDGEIFKKSGITRMFNRFGERYNNIDYDGNYNPPLSYPYSTNQQQGPDPVTESERQSRLPSNLGGKPSGSIFGSIFGFP